jgi:NADPH2:quinone reductase
MLDAQPMKAVRIDAFGGPDVLHVSDVPRPKPGAGEALVRIAVCGVNFMDVGNRRGRPGAQPGFILGGEGAGTIEALGTGVTDLHVGDRVMYAMTPGSYAEYAAVPAARLVPIPKDIDFEQAAALMLQGTTAHYLIHDFAPVGAGTTVLVHAVAGGVGLLCTQMAAHVGAHVIGTTSSAAKAAKARAAGARDVILYTETDFVAEAKRITGGKGVDLILDAVGKTTFAGDMEAARVRGTIVIYGGSSGQPDPIVPNALMAKALTLSGGALAHFLATREELLRRTDFLFAALREGWLKLSIERVLPLAQAAEAHRLLESRATSGKLLLTP